MYQAMQFVPLDNTKDVVVRAVRTKPYKSLDAAVRALIKVGHGYVKKDYETVPVWQNVV